VTIAVQELGVNVYVFALEPELLLLAPVAPPVVPVEVPVVVVPLVELPAPLADWEQRVAQSLTVDVNGLQETDVFPAKSELDGEHTALETNCCDEKPEDDAESL